MRIEESIWGNKQSIVSSNKVTFALTLDQVMKVLQVSEPHT